MRIATLGLCAVLVLPMALSGCGDGKPPVSASLTEATVSGTVKFRGKLATSGEVIFDPSNYKRKWEMARRIPINKDGTYKITTLIGENRVLVSLRLRQAMIFDVKEGENTLDIELE